MVSKRVNENHCTKYCGWPIKTDHWWIIKRVKTGRDESQGKVVISTFGFLSLTWCYWGLSISLFANQRWSIRDCEKCLPGSAWLLLSKTHKDFFSALHAMPVHMPPYSFSYKDEKKSLHVLLSMSQAGPGRKILQPRTRTFSQLRRPFEGAGEARQVSLSGRAHIQSIKCW